MVHDWIVPDWPAPPAVHAVSTTRSGGVSVAPYASMNPADHVGDAEVAVARNRELLVRELALPAAPRWLRQVHGTVTVDAARVGGVPEADASWTNSAGVVCVVLTADCLPVLLCDQAGTCVAAIHAGWRGLAAGVIEQAVAGLPARPERLLAWLGPAIGPAAYVVGDEVHAAFTARDPAATVAFLPATDGGWHADLYRLARLRLHALGVSQVSGGGWCTASDAERFFSFRRDGACGRMATLVWLAGEQGNAYDAGR